MDFMIYKYSVSYGNGTKLSGYAIDNDNKSINEVKTAISKRFYGNFKLDVRKYGAKFPPINSDYLLSV